MNKQLFAVLGIFTLSSLAIADEHTPTTLLHSCWTEAELKNNLPEPPIHKIFTPAKELTAKIMSQDIKANVNKSIRSVATDEKVLALTFDLCESAGKKSGYDAQIINTLRDYQVEATFFAGGKWMLTHPERTLQLMADPLFELGNHTWTHKNLRLTHGVGLEQQILWTQAQYEILRTQLLALPCAAAFKSEAEQLIPEYPKVFRFPYGTCDTEALTAVSRLGLAPVQWNIVTGDPSKSQSAKAIENSILNQVKPGAIIVAHANGKGWNTAKALPKIINELRSRGYKFVKVSELLTMGEPVATDSCYEVKPNDNLRYDRLFSKETP